MSETRTRTRQAPSTKQTESDESAETAAAQKAAKEAEAKAAKEAKEAEKAAAKAAADAKKAEEKAAKEAEKEAARKAKEEEAAKERQALIDSGDLIEVENDGVTTTYTTAVAKKDAVAQRAADVIQVLKDRGTEVPVSGKELADQFGGGTVQWVSFFGMLRILGLVKVYRFRSGERGGSGLSYLWVGPTD